MDQKIILDVHFKNHGSCNIYQHDSFKTLECTTNTKPSEIYEAMSRIASKNNIYQSVESIQIGSWHLSNRNDTSISQFPYGVKERAIIICHLNPKAVEPLATTALTATEAKQLPLSVSENIALDKLLCRLYRNMPLNASIQNTKAVHTVISYIATPEHITTLRQ